MRVTCLLQISLLDVIAYIRQSASPPGGASKTANPRLGSCRSKAVPRLEPIHYDLYWRSTAEPTQLKEITSLSCWVRRNRVLNCFGSPLLR